jgi:hypothetical protein
MAAEEMLARDVVKLERLFIFRRKRPLLRQEDG